MIRYLTTLLALPLVVACSGSLDINGLDSEEEEAAIFGVDRPPGETSAVPGEAEVAQDAGDGAVAPSGAAAPGDEPVSVGSVTYHADIRPLMERNCVGCHQVGEIGTFPMTTYAEVTAVGGLVRQAVDRRKMPPWPPAAGCGEFRHERRLGDAEVDAIVGWIDAGMPEGDPADYVAPAAMTVPTIGTPDLSIEMAQAYQPVPPAGGTDDYRCFAIPLELGAARALVAYEVVPSNREVAHHAAFWVVPDTAAMRSQLQALEARDSRPGYTCFGDAGIDSGTPVGAWTPGDVPAVLPAGTGYTLPASGFLVLQMHYNVTAGAGADRTRIDLRFAAGGIDTELSMAVLFDTNLNIPAGVASVMEGTSITVPTAVNVYGYLPHMHLLGKRIRIRAGDTCLIDIPDWDFNWQGFYFLSEPLRLPAGTRVEVECEFDNSTQNQPAGRAPVDVSFGDGTFDEMCGAGIIVGPA